MTLEEKEKLLGQVWLLVWTMLSDEQISVEIVKTSFATKQHDEPRKAVLKTAIKLILKELKSSRTGLNKRARKYSFDELDSLLRDQPTNLKALSNFSSLEKSIYSWNLLTQCLLASLSCLPLGERIAFVLSVTLNFDDRYAAELLEIKESAYRVRYCRGRNKLIDYLTPRCGHIHPNNPCHCHRRISIALQIGMISPLTKNEMRLAISSAQKNYNPQQKIRDPIRMYQN